MYQQNYLQVHDIAHPFEPLELLCVRVAVAVLLLLPLRAGGEAGGTLLVVRRVLLEIKFH